MAGCSGCGNSGSCSSSKSLEKCSEEKSGGCCGGCTDCDCNGKCDCAVKLKEAQKVAKDKDGCSCLLCKKFCHMAEPNRCDGSFVCHKCKTDYGWKLKKGKWIS